MHLLRIEHERLGHGLDDLVLAGWPRSAFLRRAERRAMDPHTGVAADVPLDCTHQQEDTGADAGSPLANRDRRSLCPHDPADLKCREDLATLAVDVDMEVHFPMQRVPDGIAALERVSNQLEPGTVDDATELHREGACCRLRFSLATGLAALELPPPRSTGNAGMRARRQRMCRHGGWRRKQC